MLWAGAESDAVGLQAGPDIEQLVKPDDGRLSKGFGGLLLLLSSQLALLICFVRARSHTDFSGRYRIWGWAALVGLIASVSVALDLHIVWSRSLGWWLQMKFEKLETLCWLAPAVGCGSVLIRDLLADTRKCRGSNMAIRLALVFWFAACVQILGFGLGLSGRQAMLVETGLAMLGHYFLFMGMMLHARHVIFVNAEPPAERASVFVRMARSVLKRLWRKRKPRQSENAPPKKSVATSNSGEVKSTAQDAGRNSDKPVKRAESGGDESDSQKPQLSKDDAPKRTSGGKSIRFDEPHDLDGLAGMSKRERRRQRKQKQSQRKAARRDRDS